MESASDNMSTLSTLIFEELDSTMPDPSRIMRLVELHLKKIIDSRGTSRSSVKHAESFIDDIRIRIRSSATGAAAYLPVEHVLLRFELRLMTHGLLGSRSPLDLLNIYRNFMSAHEGCLYESVFDWLSSGIEDRLFLAQGLQFNLFDFKSVFDSLKADIAIYGDVISVIKNHDLEDRCTRDALYAKLNGTLGQAAAFLACMAGSSEEADSLADEARGYLITDLQSLQRGSQNWIKGVNYITTLEWSQGRLEQALRWFSESVISASPLSLEELHRVAGRDPLVPRSNPQYIWLLMNQLRILSLGASKGLTSVRSDSLSDLEEEFLACELASYPRSMIIKWLLVLMHLSGIDTEILSAHASKLCSAARSLPAAELMRACETHIISRLSREPSEAERLEGQAIRIAQDLRRHGYFPGFFESSRWAAELFENRLEPLPIYDIATSLPYYFA